MSVFTSAVIPAQAGIQPHGRLLWIPGLRSAPPGMTGGEGIIYTKTTAQSETECATQVLCLKLHQVAGHAVSGFDGAQGGSFGAATVFRKRTA